MPDVSQIAGNTSLAASMGGAAVSGGFGLIGQALNYAFNKKLAAQQNQYNLDMWKMQADYNSPQAQMQRFKDAGLNPNLIYGQGSNGNMSSAPEMVTPQAPEISREMMELGKAFNVEQLRTIVADRKKAQAEAKIAQINADREQDHKEADEQFGYDYVLDPSNGLFVPANRPDKREQRFSPAVSYYLQQHLADNYRANMLLNSRAQLLNAQYRYLQPQILMGQYEQRFQPYSFWIGQGTKVLNALPLPKLNFKFGGQNPQTRYYNNYYH